MVFPNYKKSCDHEGNRIKICLFCCRKSKKMINIAGSLEQKLIKITNNYDKFDDRLPTVLCPACKLSIFQGLNIRASSISLEASIQKFLSIRRDLRSCTACDNECQCYLCNAVRKAPETVAKKSTNIKKDSVKKRCYKCLSPIGKGLKHKCTGETALSNIKNNVFEKNEKQKEHLVVDILKDRVPAKNNFENSSNSENDRKIMLSHKHGKPIAVELAADNKKAKKSIISTDTLNKIKTNLNLSGRKLFGMTAAIKIESNNLIGFEKNYQKQIVDKTHTLDDFFEICSFKFVNELNNKITDAPGKAIICKNLGELINFVIGSGQRNLNLSDVDIKFGIDGGGGFLKICMSLQTSKCKAEQELKYKRKNYNKIFADSGVKKLFIICLASGVQENYTNISLLWSKLKINEHLGYISSDLKIINMICGLMSSSCTHPCPYCDSKSNILNVGGAPRTLIECKNNYEKWLKSEKCEKKTAKNFKNCINMPLLPIAEQKILYYIPPPELHLLLGAVNTIFDKMLASHQNIALEWAKKCNVSRKCNQGRHSMFVGNDCKKLLNSIDILDSFKCLEICSYVEVFRKLKSVVEACFSIKLDPKYKESIENFKKSYLALEISVTPKIHIIFEHVVEFCEYYGQGLGYFSEQAMEAVHCDFKATWNNYKISKDHEDYFTNLLRSTCVYNSLHL